MIPPWPHPNVLLVRNRWPIPVSYRSQTFATKCGILKSFQSTSIVNWYRFQGKAWNTASVFFKSSNKYHTNTQMTFLERGCCLFKRPMFTRNLCTEMMRPIKHVGKVSVRSTNSTLDFVNSHQLQNGVIQSSLAPDIFKELVEIGEGIFAAKHFLEEILHFVWKHNRNHCIFWRFQWKCQSETFSSVENM